MNMLQQLKLQGQINAIEFFGVNVRTLKELSLDLMDSRREALNRPNGAHLVVYQGRTITVNQQSL